MPRSNQLGGLHSSATYFEQQKYVQHYSIESFAVYQLWAEYEIALSAFWILCFRIENDDYFAFRN